MPNAVKVNAQSPNRYWAIRLAKKSPWNAAMYVAECSNKDTIVPTSRRHWVKKFQGSWAANDFLDSVLKFVPEAKVVRVKPRGRA